MLVWSWSVAAAIVKTPYSRDEFCANVKDEGYASELLLLSASRLNFKNKGGFFDQGVCWWHDRFTRAAAYLTVYKPMDPKPNKDQAVRLIRDLRKMNTPVVIPGFSNLSEFSGYFENEIQSELDRWQQWEAFSFGWLNGLEGSSEVTSNELAEIMDATFDRVVYQKQVVFQMLQHSGPTAHSWLVVKMKSTPTGYRLLVADSNLTNLKVWEYKRGMTHFFHVLRGNFVPYIQTDTVEEELKLKRVVKAFCQ